MRELRTAPSAAVFAFVSSALIVAQYVAGRATRDTLFLTHFPATDLPKAVIAAALVSLVGTLGMSSIQRRASPVRLVPALFALSGISLAAIWGLIRLAPALGAVVLYAQVALFGLLSMSGFYAVVNERFDPHSAKPIVARVAAFAALGGVMGGAVSHGVSDWLGVEAVVLALAVLHLACAGAVREIGAPERPREGAAALDDASSGFALLLRTPYLIQMLALVSLCCATDTLLDYAIKSAAAERFGEGRPLMRFFAVFYTATGVLTFALQASLGARVLRRFGLGGAMALLPGAVLLSGALAVAMTRLWTLVLVRAAEAVVANSLFAAGFQLLYMPLAASTTRATKALVDVGGRRIGDVVGAGLVMLLLTLLPSLDNAVVVGLAAALSLGALALVFRLHSGYVEHLASSLRSGSLALDALDALDATTARTIAQTRSALDRGEILAEIRALRGELAGSGAVAAGDRGRSADADAHPATTGAAPAAPPDPELARIAALRSGDRSRVRAALVAPLHRRLVPHVIDLLDAPEQVEHALSALRRSAATSIGLITDALLDASFSVAARRVLPRALERCPDARALEGLLVGLEDPDFEMRVQCARSAAKLVARAPDLRLERDRAFSHAMRELAVGIEQWERQGRREAGSVDPQSLLLSGLASASVDRSLEHVFTLLALGLDVRVVGSALRGLCSEDGGLRGTALEYLESALPHGLRQALWPRLDAAAAPRRAPRQRQELARELLQSSQALVLERDAMPEGEP